MKLRALILAGMFTATLASTSAAAITMYVDQTAKTFWFSGSDTGNLLCYNDLVTSAHPTAPYTNCVLCWMVGTPNTTNATGENSSQYVGTTLDGSIASSFTTDAGTTFSGSLESYLYGHSTFSVLEGDTHGWVAGDPGAGYDASLFRITFTFSSIVEDSVTVTADSSVKYSYTSSVIDSYVGNTASLVGRSNVYALDTNNVQCRSRDASGFSSIEIVDANAVPEPKYFAGLAGLGALGLAFSLRKKRG